MNKSKILQIFVPAILFLCVFASADLAYAQGASGKTSTTTTAKPKTTKTNTKTIKPKSKKTPDPPIADWEMNNLPGHWEGLHDKIKSDLEIESVDGDNFSGYFTTEGGFKIAFTGTVDRAARKITFTETEILAKPADGDWRLGVNTGRLDYGAFGMKGTGKDDNDSVYTWSYIQML